MVTTAARAGDERADTRSTAPAPRDGEARASAPGDTEISTKAIASTVRGVVRECRTDGGLDTHDVSVDRGDQALELRVRADVPYPRSIRRTGGELQRAVSARVPELTGEQVHGVEIVCVPSVRERPPRVSRWPGWASAIRRLVAALVAIALTAGAIVVAADIVASQVGDGPVVADWGSWLDSARDTPWDDGAVLGFGFGATALGLLLLVLALLPPRRRRTIDVTTDGAVAEWRLTTDDLAAQLARVAERETGAHGARATVRGDRVKLRMKTKQHDRDAVRDRATEAVRDRFVELTHRDRPKVRVDVRRDR